MANRNLLIEVGETPRFDPNFLAASTTISNNGKTLTRNAAGVGSSRVPRARSTGKLFARATGNFTVGRIAFGVGTQYEIATNRCGQTLNSWSLSETAGNWAYDHNNSLTQVAAIANGDYAYIAVDIAAGKMWVGRAAAATPNTITWALSGNPATGANPTWSNLLTDGTIVAGVQRLFYLMGSVTNTNDTMTIQTDWQSLAATLPDGFTPWGELGFFAMQSIATTPADTTYSASSGFGRYYDGRIVADADPTYKRAASVWMMASGTGRPDTPISSLDLHNGDGALDYMIEFNLRDVLISGYMYTISPTTRDIPDSSAWTPAFVMIGDHGEEHDEQQFRIVLKDKLAQLDTPAQKNLYPASVTNQQLVGTPKPLALGFIGWAPLTAVDSANLEYDIADGPFAYASGPNEIDQGVTITQGAGWSASSQAQTYGIRRLTNPAGKQAFSFAGRLNVTTLLVNAEPFGTWVAGDPPGFMHVVNANTTLTNPSTTVARLQCSNAAGGANWQATLQPTAACVNGNWYFVEIIVTAVASGSASVVLQPTSGAVVQTTSFCEITKAGTYRFGFQATSTNRPIGIEWGKNLCDITISGLNVWNGTQLGRLPAWCTDLMINRGGLDASEVDIAGTITALDTATAYVLGFFTLQASNLLDLVIRTFDTFGGGIWQDRLGVIKGGRLVDPTGGTSVATFDSINIFGDVVWADDTAPGLSAQFAGVQNFSPHGEGEIAGSVLLTDVGTQLRQQYTVTKTTATPFDSFYAAALSRDAHPTMLMAAAQLQTEATRIGALYAVRRRIWTFQAFLTDSLSYQLNPFDVVTLSITDRYGAVIAAGLKLCVLSVESRFTSDLVSLVCWG